MSSKYNFEPPFMVIRYIRTALEMEYPVYEVVTSMDRRGREVSSDEAELIVDKYDMMISYRDNREGFAVWEQKGRPFYNQYKGYFRKINEMKRKLVKQNEENSKQRQYNKLKRKMEKRDEILKRRKQDKKDKNT